MIYSTETKKCGAHIATNRNRIKSYDSPKRTDGSPRSVVYLKDEQKFEIELYNPHNFKVLAKIKFNGVDIGESGLVLRPGERIYLERYLDSNNAFVFSTYEVDNSAESLNAISNNGDIDVEFFAERIPFSSMNIAGSSTVWGTPDWSVRPDSQPIYGGTTINNAFLCSSNNDVFGQNTSITTTAGFGFKMDVLNETGRVEKGEETNQQFTQTYDTFSVFPFETTSIKILPASNKPVTQSEIRNYCTECGTRMKKATWKFCPNCGTKA
jgi:hypothetical protein